MPNYTFTTVSSYSLDTHEVHFTRDTLTIKLTSTKQVVYSKSYGTAGLAFKCSANDFCIGTLNDNGTFNKTVDFRNYANAAMWLVEEDGQNVFIGTNDETDTGVYNQYDLNQCPVRLKEANDIVTIECPCASSSGPCGNSCYTYGD